MLVKHFDSARDLAGPSGVVADSATGQLGGLTATLAITIADGKHSYDFEYSLAETP